MEMRPPGGGSSAIAADPWRLIAPGHAWNELVLPDRQRESLRAIADGLPTQSNGGGWSSANSSGVLVLFAGPVGTGKSMAARIIGAQLRVPILEVDTTALGAGDRSGLEHTIGRVFATARAQNAILFFEQADALLSERPLPSARPPRPGTLTAPDLFDRAERHAGLVIFASTLRGKIDPAYRTRFSSVIEFPFPDREGRERIWRQLLPPDARLTQSDVEDLASSFQLPGATIAGCVLTAVAAADEQHAPVTLLDVAAAVQAEYRRRLASESTLRAVSGLIARARASRPESSRPRDLDRGASNGAPPAPGPIEV
ncbi:MAG: ATP-binding protein, partial [Actinomycetota bacterium]|nr:ATP-binding protein [Actinomycetota bacterium]